MNNIDKYTALLTSKWDCLYKPTSVFGLTWEVREGSEIFEYLCKKLNFNKFVEDQLNKKYSDEELELLESSRKLKEGDDRLNSLIKSSIPKITIKIELEKYED